jgi:hypothetical protein
MRVKALIWLGVKTAQADAMSALYRAMGLEAFQEDTSSSRFRLENGTEVHVYGPADKDHDFFGAGPVVGFLVENVEQARAEMEAAGAEFIGDIQVSETHSWSHFCAPDGNVYEIMAEP